MSKYTYTPSHGTIQEQFPELPANYNSIDLTFAAEGRTYEGPSKLCNFLLNKAICAGQLPANVKGFGLTGRFGSNHLPVTRFEMHIGRTASIQVGDIEVWYGTIGDHFSGEVKFKGTKLEPLQVNEAGLSIVPASYEARRSKLPDNILRRPGLAAAVIFGDYEHTLSAAALRGDAKFFFKSN